MIHLLGLLLVVYEHRTYLWNKIEDMVSVSGLEN
jgi:hypothetical protein